ncbi:MAG: type I DNA topoisomerase [Desulfurella sp.]|uniref:type I DNA topoisomerase n=2 Tax=Desulfurella sp. TaxID=1962857 RepID=UPI003D09B0A9
MNLVIVESPAKAKTISRFLGKDYEVIASYGHIRDLPKNNFGVDIEHDFKPKYTILKDKKPIVEKIKTLSEQSDRVYIATDEDREGEAIGYHIVEAGKVPKDKVERIVFHEITKEAILNALKNPRSIDKLMVDSQESRRILDRIVGYKLSPLLAKKIRRGLSAGRVQSVALKLIVEREEEIKNFTKQEYWTLHLIFSDKNKDVESILTTIDNVELDKFSICNAEKASQIKSEILKEQFVVENITKKTLIRKPKPPYITSTLQAEASTILGFSPKKTMQIAQKLYEGVSLQKERMGLITYMRTDSLNVARQAQEEALDIIKKFYGQDYAPKQPNIYKTKSKTAQEAHEAIRPTKPSLLPDMVKEYLTQDEYKLYNLIWKKFMASQAASAKINSVNIIFSSKRFKSKASFNELVFDGYLKIWDLSDNDFQKAPSFKQNDKVILKEVLEKQHFTEPPPRYSEASLIKTLESYGIGRPSTYATIIDTILERQYVVLNDKKFYPTQIGIIVSKALDDYFKDIINVDFTAKLEEDLDNVAKNKVDKTQLLKNFYEKFRIMLDKAYEQMDSIKPKDEPTDMVCELCGAPMVIRQGRFGKFLACSNYPKCKNTKSLNEETVDIVCNKCGAKMVVKYSKKGGKFLACSNYPDCKNTMPYPTGLKCPACGGDLVEKTSKRGKFYGCSNYPNCKFTIKGNIINKKCPKCGYELFRILKDSLKCANPDCDYKEPIEKEILEKL